jgi:hypothetical protein
MCALHGWRFPVIRRKAAPSRDFICRYLQKVMHRVGQIQEPRSTLLTTKQDFHFAFPSALQHIGDAAKSRPFVFPSPWSEPEQRPRLLTIEEK